ncbi:MAG TPA: glycosyltransferase family 2 protein [Polyangia bacterium]
MGNPSLERTAPTLPLPPAEKTGVSAAPRVAVVIPAFNESTAIQEVVATVKTAFDWVIVVDDGSADDTAARAQAAGAHVLVHPINLGQGAALQTGLEYALLRGADLIATFDADGQHCVEDIPVMIAALEKSGAEIALGSRFLGTTESMPASRKLLLKAATLFTRFTTGLRLTDAHNGMRLFTRAGARKIQIRQNRMAHASEILSQIAELEVPFVEVPVTIRYTNYSMAKGQSSFGAINIVLDLIIQRLK